MPTEALPLPARRTILGVGVDDVVLPEAMAAVEALLAEGGTHQIVTINPEFVITARDHRAFRAVLNRARLAVPDGFGLLIAARYLNQPLRGRVTGVELSLALAELAARRGLGLFLLGAAPGVAEAAAAVLQQRYPGLRIAGCYAGSPLFAEAAAIRMRVAASGAAILLVAYGHPAQELWIAEHAAACGVQIAVGVGGTFDYLAGHVPRAPRLLRQLGLEWLYRLLRQPWRWRRIVDAVPRFLWYLIVEGKG